MKNDFSSLHYEDCFSEERLFSAFPLIFGVLWSWENVSILVETSRRKLSSSFFVEVIRGISRRFLRSSIASEFVLKLPFDLYLIVFFWS